MRLSIHYISLHFFYSMNRITNRWKKSVVFCCVLVIYNTCSNLAIGHKLHYAIHHTFTRCVRIAWSPERWSSGVIIGREASIIVKQTMYHLPAFSHKLADYIMFIIFGVSVSFQKQLNSFDCKKPFPFSDFRL